MEASPEAKSKIVEGTVDAVGITINVHHKVKYPLAELKIGQCFTIPIAECNETSVRVTANKFGRTYGKKFSVIKHPTHGIYEVARIA